MLFSMVKPIAACRGVAAALELPKLLRTLTIVLLVAASMPAAADALVPGSGAPGSVVADVRAQLALGYVTVSGSAISAGVEPELLFLRPDGCGFGIDIGCRVLGSPPGGAALVGGIGPKLVAVRRMGRSPFYSKFGAGLSLLFGLQDGIGARAVFETGIAPLVAGRAAFPVEAFLSGQVGAGCGLSATLGVSVGAGWVFGGR